jgi:hypothetical protein
MNDDCKIVSGIVVLCVVLLVGAVFVNCGTERRMCLSMNQGMTETASCLNALADTGE